MTDYAEEQRNELEAIESIYPDSFTVLSEVPTSFTITVTSDAGENDETIEVTLQFTYVEKYPDEVPLWEIYSQENLEDSDAEGILTLLQQQAEENLGMVMIFTLVTAVQDKLNELVDEIKNRREEEKRRKEEAAEEAEKVLFQGTVVTIENFLSWKAKFELGRLNSQEKSYLRPITILTHQIYSSWKILETVLKWTSPSSRTLRNSTWMKTTLTLTLWHWAVMRTERGRGQICFQILFKIL
uniref:RWD domain-containing protein 1 n=1 Tax=Oncorhynchus tshawytscha TaxID=74940 RepID=A0AAZ3RJK1_ONCTS